MGRDKALIEIDGVPMVRRVAVALREAGARTVIAVGGDAPRLAEALAGLDVRLVPDDTPGAGPLAGLLTALGNLPAFGPDPTGTGDPGASAAAPAGTGEPDAGTGIALVVSCDLLAPSARSMAATVDALARRDVDTHATVPRAEGHPQWLHAAWRHSAASPLRHEHDRGERSIRRAVAAAALSVEWIDDLDTATLADADTPKDLRNPPVGHGH